MKLRIFLVLSTICAFLTACGGGSDSTPTTPVTSGATTFPLDAAYTKAYSNAVSLSSTAVDGADTYSATESLTPASDEVFEGVVRKKAIKSATIKKNGVLLTVTNSQHYFSINPFVLRGARYQDGTYAVQTNIVGAFASAAKVGDSGALGVLTVYNDTSKTSIQSTTASTWTLEADTATTAFSCVNRILKNAAGEKIATATNCDKIDTNGNRLGVRDTLSVDGKTLIFK